MAWLILVDGSKMKVDYNRAATIYQALTGKKELDKKDPDFKKKEEFLLKVKEVQFDDDKTNKGPRPWEKPNWWKHNEKSEA